MQENACGCPCKCCHATCLHGAGDEVSNFDHCRHCLDVAEEAACLGDHIRAFVARCERIDLRRVQVSDAFAALATAFTLMEDYRRAYGSDVAFHHHARYQEAVRRKQALVRLLAQLATESAAYDQFHFGSIFSDYLGGNS